MTPQTDKGRADVVVLGASGMLGAVTAEVFAGARELKVAATVRDEATRGRLAALYPEIEWRLLDAETATEGRIAEAIGGARWLINCIGIIKPYIHDDHVAEIERAIRVNSLYPTLLGRIAERLGARLLQIATDCVYSGATGRYDEGAPHDALDVYGKTKSLGEPFSVGTNLLRCSIIGPEPKAFVSLLEWFLGQPMGAQVNGFTNHQWNGVTTLHFARLCRGIIAERLELPRLHHVVPTATLSKADMLGCFARVYGRGDVRINPVEAKTVIDRTLSTRNAELNGRLWKAAGYAAPPTVAQMIEELGAFEARWLKGRR